MSEALTGRTAEPDPRERLISDHLGLAKGLARRFIGRGIPYDDLVQVACLALVKAADNYDAEHRAAFSSYATPMIIGELKHHLRDQGWLVRAPRRLQELYAQVNESAARLSQQLGRSPTLHELADANGRRVDEILAAMEAGRGYRAEPLDPLFEEATGSLPPTTLGDDDGVLEARLARLAPRDALIVRLRFFDELSQDAIAERIGISQMHVSRLLRRAMEELRRPE
jgi:RNA polymerase sigma-B factor